MYREEVTIDKPRRAASEEANPANMVFSHFQPPELGETFLVQAASPWSTVLAAAAH